MKNITSRSLLLAVFTFSATPMSDNGDYAMLKARIERGKPAHEQLKTLSAKLKTMEAQIDTQMKAIEQTANNTTRNLIENGYEALRNSENAQDGGMAQPAFWAKDAFENALMVTPNSIEAHLGMAYACDIVKDFECAQKHEDRAIELEKRSHPPYKNLNRLSRPPNPDVLLAM